VYVWWCTCQLDVMVQVYVWWCTYHTYVMI